MAALTTFKLVDAGTAPTFDNASVSDTAEVGNGKNTFLVVKNADTVAHVVKIVVPGNTDYGQANPDPSITVSANTGQAWIPLRKEFADSANAGVGRCTINTFAADGTTPGATSVTVKVVQVG